MILALMQELPQRCQILLDEEERRLEHRDIDYDCQLRP
jgi:hypothetical protein